VTPSLTCRFVLTNVQQDTSFSTEVYQWKFTHSLESCKAIMAFTDILLLAASLTVEMLYSLAVALVMTVVGWLKWCLPSAFSKDIRGQIVLVTGGGRGIGQTMCVKFAQRGATVVTVDLKEEFNKETIK